MALTDATLARMSKSTEEERRNERLAIERKTAEFLARGGKIEQHDTGETGIKNKNHAIDIRSVTYASSQAKKSSRT